MAKGLIRALGVACLALAAIGGAPARAETYPSRPIDLVVPYAPGGASDVIARTLAPYLQQELGVNIIVSNRAGANTAIAATYMTRAPHDGYTVMLADVALVLNAAEHGPAAGYDPVKDYTPMGMVGSAPFVLFVPDAGASLSLKDFLAEGKNRPLNIANAGPGSLGHLGAELLRLKTSLNIVSVPYRGSGPAMTDTIARHVDATFGSTASGMPLVATHQLRALAVAAPQRMADFPDIPTFDELGYPGVNVLNWWGIIAPAGTDPQRADRIHEALVKIAARPDVQQKLSALGVTPTIKASADYGKVIKQDMELWRKVVVDANIKVD
ncbi:MAG TPA: tripartite tricarboxylate transporter substrate binding protein [Bordetella sp.]|nr:tripartite tricarboxylate transporter substrate binding protein [Bordetella sp.]